MKQLFYVFLVLFRDCLKRKIDRMIALPLTDIKNFCKCFKKLNIIKTFHFITYKNKKMIEIFFKVNNLRYYFTGRFYYNLYIENKLGNYNFLHTTITKFKIISSPGNKKKLSYKKLKYTYVFNVIRIISTDVGFLTCKECLKKKIGGTHIVTLIL